MADIPGTPSPPPASSPAASPAPGAGGSSPAGGSSSPGSSGLGQVSQGSSGLATPPAPSGSGISGGTPAAAQSPSFRDSLRNYGVDLGNRFQDDNSALQHLAQAYQQSQQQNELARYGQEYVRHASEFQAWQRARQEEQARLQQNQNNWWKAPEYDPTWASRLMRDPTTGEIRALPGQPPDLVQKYTAWAEHQRTFMDRFAQDPIQAIRPGIEQVVQQMAGQIVEQQLTAYRQQSEAQSFVQEHSEWLHARDAQGRLIPDARTGMPALSPLGQRFLGYVQQAEQIGLRDVRAQREHALGLVQRDYLLAQAQGGQRPAPGTPAPAADPAAAARNNFLQQNAGNPPTPAAPAGNVNGAVPPASGSRGLAEMLMRDLQAQGFAPGQLIT